MASPIKRTFTHAGRTFTVIVSPELSQHNAFIVHVSRSGQSTAQSGGDYQKTYAFPQFRHPFSPLEQQPIITDLHTFARTVLERGDELPDELPEDWGTQFGR